MSPTGARTANPSPIEVAISAVKEAGSVIIGKSYLFRPDIDDVLIISRPKILAKINQTIKTANGIINHSAPTKL